MDEVCIHSKSESKVIFENILVKEYNIKDNVSDIVETCLNSPILKEPIPLYDIVFYKIIRDTLKEKSLNIIQ